MYVWVIVCEMHCIRIHKAHTHYSTCSSPCPAGRHNRCTTALAKGGTPCLLPWSPPFDQHASCRPSSPDVDARPRTTPRTTSRFPPCPPASSPTSATPTPSQWPCTHWEGGWAVHGRGEENKATQGDRGTQKEGPHLGRRKRLLVTPIDRTLCPVSATTRDETGREPRPKTNTKTIDSRCSIQA